MGSNYYEKRNKYSDEFLVALYEQYGSQGEAAKHINVSRETIARAVRRKGIPLTGRKLNGKNGRKCGGSPRKITDEELLEESKTMTRQEISEKHNMSITNVDRKLHRLGIHCVPAKARPTEGVRDCGKYANRVRAAGFGAEYDHNVKLSRLIERQYGICQICGLAVDVSDRRHNKIGNLYPTLDHIIPIAEGGSHTWDNVQLAHMRCNSLKGTKYA